MRTAATVIATVALLLPAAGCGGSAGSHVAQLGSTAARTGTTSSNASGSSSSGSGTLYAEALHYSQCMRSHGIGDFPRPSAGGTFALGGLDQNSPAFQSAQQACRPYLPIRNLGPAQHARMERIYVRFASCIRSHGIGNFPDPVTGNGNEVGFHLPSSSELDTNSPTFLNAVRACQHILGHQFRFRSGPSGGKGG